MSIYSKRVPSGWTSGPRSTLGDNKREQRWVQRDILLRNVNFNLLIHTLLLKLLTEGVDR